MSGTGPDHIINIVSVYNISSYSVVEIEVDFYSAVNNMFEDSNCPVIIYVENVVRNEEIPYPVFVKKKFDLCKNTFPRSPDTNEQGELGAARMG